MTPIDSLLWSFTAVGQILLFITLFVAQGLLFIAPALPSNLAAAYKGLDDLPLLGNWKPPVNKALFGENKTWRGLLVGFVVTLPVMYLFVTLHAGGWLGNSYVPYSHFGLWPSVFIMSAHYTFCALGGDMIKSIFKRHWAKIPPGQPWNPWDRIDFVLGTYAFMFPYYLGDWPKTGLLFTSCLITLYLTNRLQKPFNILMVKYKMKREA